MGLRRRISIYLIGVLSLLAALTLLVLQSASQQQALQLDEVEARGDLHRLLGTLQARSLEVNGTLKAWANWTALYEHMLAPSARFKDEELSVEALAAGNLDFLLLFDLTGNLTNVSEAPGAAGATPVADGAMKYASVFTAVRPDTPRAVNCGAGKFAAQLALVCFRPILNSEGKGTPHGYVVAGQWITPDIIRQVSDTTGLTFQVAPAAATPPLAADPMNPSDSTLFAQAAVKVQQQEDQLVLSYPLMDLLGQPIADIQMTWPRKHALQADKSHVTTQAVVVALIVACGVLLVLLLDRVVVRRLNRLRDELALIVESKRWTGDLSTSGRDELAALAGYIRELIRVVRQQVEALNELSQTDPLTKLPNRRAFDLRLEQILAQHGRQQLPAALILMDVDHFKKYNDTYGHPAGDVALQKIADCLRSTLRRELDLPARLGGEEFAALLQGVTAEQACAAAEQIRATLQGMGLVHRASQPLGVMTISLGVALVTSQDNATTLYRRADEALYRAKHLGRNQVARAD